MAVVPEASREPKIAVEATADGMKVSVSGQPAKQAGDVLLDILSPLTNAAGFVGDRLADARKLAAIRAAAKTRDLLKAEGITKGDVPPKILLPWLEAASLEEDETLQSAWAGLLARAVKSADAVNVSYIETLKRLGKAEAELLNFFAMDTSPYYSIKFYDLNQSEMFSTDNSLLPNILKALDGADTPESLASVMEDLGLQGARQVIFFSVNGGAAISTAFFAENEHAVSNLEHLGLVRISRAQLQGRTRRYLIVWFELTKYGFDLFWACQGTLTGGWNDILSESRTATSSKEKK